MSTIPAGPVAGTNELARRQAVLARDAAADGLFVYSVSTTGIYCRPSCASRQARPEHLAFHDTAEAAEQAGFRPCRRCHPRGPSLAERHRALVTQACRLIEASDVAPDLNTLAAAAGLSAAHFHRCFRRITGVTPKAYASTWRAARVATGLQAERPVTEVIHDSGFSSASRFYDPQQSRLGMAPARYRAGGKGEQIRFAVGQCTLGAILVAATQRGVCAIFLGDSAEGLVRNLQDRFPHASLQGGDADFERMVATVVGFVGQPGTTLGLPLDISGTAFQQRVWQALQRIPPGQTRTYAQLAEAIGQAGSARAVAGACAANLLAVAIPCHRVIRTDGALSGYRWGVERKAVLLDQELRCAGEAPVRE